MDIANLFKQRLLEIQIGVGAHLTDAHVFSLVLNDHLLKKVVFLNSSFFGFGYLLSGLLRVQIVEVYFITVFVLESVQAAVGAFLQQKLGQV